MFTRVMLVNVKVFSVLIHFNEMHEYNIPIDCILIYVIVCLTVRDLIAQLYVTAMIL